MNTLLNNRYSFCRSWALDKIPPKAIATTTNLWEQLMSWNSVPMLWLCLFQSLLCCFCRDSTMLQRIFLRARGPIFVACFCIFHIYLPLVSLSTAFAFDLLLVILELISSSHKLGECTCLPRTAALAKYHSIQVAAEHMCPIPQPILKLHTSLRKSDAPNSCIMKWLWKSKMWGCPSHSGGSSFTNWVEGWTNTLLASLP